MNHKIHLLSSWNLGSPSKNHFIRTWMKNNAVSFILSYMIFTYEKYYPRPSNSDIVYRSRINDFNINLFNVVSTLQQH